MQEKGSKKHIPLPEKCKEYLTVYTTEYDDTYVLETIVSQDLEILRNIIAEKSEQMLEAQFNFDVQDDLAGFKEKEQLAKIRKLNKKIGDNLKLLCPNHYSIIHDVEPVFDRKRLLYIYANGLEEKLVLNQHLQCIL